MAQNHIETLKTSIYSPKHAANTKIHYQIYKKSKLSSIRICKKRKKNGLLIFIALFILLRATQPN